MNPIQPMFRKVDVAILGGGMCGVGTAFTLANQGKKVLLVERRSMLGWEATSAFQCELNLIEESPLASHLHNKLASIGGLCGDRLDPPILEILLHRLITEKGIDFLLYSHPLRLITEGNFITAVVIGHKGGEEIVRADMFVDATEEALLWRETDLTFLDTSSVPVRQTIFFNNTHKEIKLPLSLSSIGNIQNITVQPSVREGEVCVEFDLSEYSISRTRLALSKVICFIRAGVQQLTHSLVTHTGNEPFPLEVSAHLKEEHSRHPYFKNLFSAGTWTIPEESERQRVNTLTERIKLGEKTGLLMSHVHEKIPNSKEENISDSSFTVSPPYYETDVVVCGGGTAGVFAAIASARQGAKVILLEASTLLGGIGTGGGIHVYYYPVGLNRRDLTAREFEVNEEILKCYYALPGGLQNEVDLRTAKISTFLFDGGYRSAGFHPEAKKLVLEQMCHESGVEVIYGATVIGVKMDKVKKNLIRGVVAATPWGNIICHGKIIIDSTGDIDVAAKAGVPFTIGRESDKLTHDFGQCVRRLDHNGNMCVVNNDAGYVYPFDVRDLTRARYLGIQQYWGWWNNHRLLYISPLIGFRQSRQIIGDYQLTLNDQILGRRFDDAIGYMKAHHDNHACDYENESDEGILWIWLMGNLERIIGCEVPYRCLLPQGVEGLLVACRGASMTIDAHYAFRMQPEMQQMGEAAGIAAALAVKLGVTPRELDARLIQDILEKEGVLNERKHPRPLLTEHPLSTLKEILLSNSPQKAVWQLVHCKSEEKKKVISLLKDVIHAGSAQSRFWAAVALAMHKDNEAVPELLNCVRQRRNEIPEGRKTVPLWWSAIVMLGRIGNSRAVPVLLEVLSDDQVNFDLLITVVRALGRIQDKSAISGLLQLLKWLKNKDFSEVEKIQRPVQEDIRWQIELAVAETLAKLEKPQPSIIEHYLNDSRAYVRRYATKIAKINNFA